MKNKNLLYFIYIYTFIYIYNVYTHIYMSETYFGQSMDIPNFSSLLSTISIYSFAMVQGSKGML